MPEAMKDKRRRRWPAFVAGMLTATLLLGLIWGWQTLRNTGVSNIQQNSYTDNDKILHMPPPSLVEMARDREAFRHELVHPHPDEKGNEIIAQRLTRLGIEPDQGTLDLLNTIAEKNQIPVQLVVSHLLQIASGSDTLAKVYGVSLQRRLAADAIPQGSKIKAENLRYEIAMRWISIDNNKWGKQVVVVEMRLPENPTAIVSSFLYAQQEIMSHGSAQAALRAPFNLY